MLVLSVADAEVSAALMDRVRKVRPLIVYYAGELIMKNSIG